MTAWTYSQRTGEMRDPEGNVVETGYAGAGPGTNRPAAEHIENVGPVPTGDYRIEPARDHPTCGPCSLPLTPDADNEMHDRSGFLIHGDNADHTASTGCIILSRTTRDMIEASSVRDLVVTV